MQYSDVTWSQRLCGPSPPKTRLLWEQNNWLTTKHNKGVKLHPESFPSWFSLRRWSVEAVGLLRTRHTRAFFFQCYINIAEFHFTSFHFPEGDSDKHSDLFLHWGKSTNDLKWTRAPSALVYIFLSVNSYGKMKWHINHPCYWWIPLHPLHPVYLVASELNWHQELQHQQSLVWG